MNERRDQDEIVDRPAECGDFQPRGSGLAKRWLGSRRLSGWALAVATAGFFVCGGQVAAQTAPTVTSVSIVSRPDSGGAYTLGEAVEVAIELDSPVDFCSSSSEPVLTLEVGKRMRQAQRSNRTYDICIASSLEFWYHIRPNDIDSDGVSIPENALTFASRQLTLADPSHDPVGPDPDHQVDGSVVVAPRIIDIWINSEPLRASDGSGFPEFGDTYGVGAEIAVAVEFDKPVDLTGARPEVALRIGERLRPARLLRDRGQSGRLITFFYVVESEDVDGDGIDIPANALALNGGTITIRGDANTDAILSHDTVASDFNVDGETVSAPEILYKRAFLAGSPLNGRTFGLGERIWTFLWLDRRPAVTGVPELALQIGGRTRRASYFPVGSYNSFLSFVYLVQSDDLDTEGFATPANAVNLNGGSIVSAGSADINADLGHDRVDYGVGVDGSIVVAPSILRISLGWPPSLGGAYALGDRVVSAYCFNLPVKVKGRPRVRLNVGGETRHASYSSTLASSGSITCLNFWYEVQAGDLDGDGISIPANALDLNGGAITLEVDDAIAAELGHRESRTTET